MRSILAPLALCLALLAPVSARAVQPSEVLSDPKLESRARDISADLRCMVCQNQSIDDSDAPLARDLRVLVREQIVAGKSDAEVRDYLVSRYGDFILLKPPFKLETALLWGLPALIVAAGALGLVAAARRRRAVAAAPLTDDERRRLERMLEGE
ncbi:MAG: cytochrome c-type biogenesis protein CcmH [Rhizobiales bacterium]|nr:cytochrome c-type biogenesis protein CcmH [Hyphomicrobiales bacterium]